jgi:hypothetical protein
MWKSIVIFGAVVFLSLPAFAQETSKYTEIPLNFLDQGKGGPTIGDKPNFLREKSIAIQSPLFGLDKVERMPIAKGPVDFHSNMPMKEMGDSLRYNMPILKERKDW